MNLNLSFKLRRPVDPYQKALKDAQSGMGDVILVGGMRREVANGASVGSPSKSANKPVAMKKVWCYGRRRRWQWVQSSGAGCWPVLTEVLLFNASRLRDN